MNPTGSSCHSALPGQGRGQGTLALPPSPGLSLTLNLLCEGSADTWGNFGRELKETKNPTSSREQLSTLFTTLFTVTFWEQAGALWMCAAWPLHSLQVRPKQLL